jgi:tetratricopeptide (TPR) repeat protein/serine/threonine protein kinase
MTTSDASHSDSEADRAEALLGACLEEAEAHLEALVERMCERHPERATAIRDEVEAAQAGGLRRRSPGSSERAPWESAPVFERIGPYQPLREIGRGGQGFVYLAEDTRLHRVVALKVLKGHGSLADKVILRFRREAEVASRIDHPGICGVYDAGVAAGIPYIAMRYVEGRTLSDAIRLARASLTPEPSVAEYVAFEDGKDSVPPELPAGADVSSASTRRKRSEILRIVAVVEKTARALHAAHEAGIIHRDIKPANIMVTPHGEPVILDFGLASEEANELCLTQTGDLFGTPAYMSPEQLMAHRIRLDRRTDVYSLAVTLYECITLRRPFEAATRQSVYQAIQYKDPAHARKLNREIPSDLEVVLEKALEKDRDRRYATALDFAEDLRRVREVEPIRARRASTVGRLSRWAQRRPARAALATVLAVGIPAVAALTGYAIAKAPEVRKGEEIALLATVERRLEEGYFELAHGDPKVALSSFDAALALKPDSVEAIGGKASALHDCRDFAACLRFLEEHEGDEGTDFAFTRTRYDALSWLGRQAEADAFAKRSRRDARTPHGWFLAGIIQLQECDKQRDRNVFRSAVRLFTSAALTTRRPRALYHFGLAHAAQHLGDVETSRRVCEALDELWPDSPTAAYFAGCAAGAVDATAAVAAYRKAIRLKPDDVRPLHNLTLVLLQRGARAEAVDACRKFIAQNPGIPQGHYELGCALHAAGKTGDAVAAFRRSIALGPDHWAYMKLGSALREMGELDEAVVVLRRAVALAPVHAPSHFHLGLALKDQGRIDEAVAANRTSIALSPYVAESYVNLAMVLASKGEFDEAAALLRKATELDPRLFQAHLNLGHVLLSMKRPEDAVAAFQKAIELSPTEAVGHYNLGVALRESGRIDEAVAAYRKAIESAPDDPDFYVALAAVLCDKKGEHDAAVEVLQKAIALRPDHADAQRNAAIALNRKGDADFTIAVVRRLIAKGAGHSDLYYALGLALGGKGDLDGSIEIWRKLIALRPDDAMARTNLAVSFRQKGDVDAAIAGLREAVIADPRYLDAYFNLGLLLREKGGLDEAIATWRKELAIRPDSERCYRTLAETQMMQGKFVEAVASFQKVVELNPKAGNAHYNLGVALERAERRPEALAAYERAVELAPNIAEAHCNLGGYYERDGRLFLALESYRRGHELGSASPGWAYPSAQWMGRIEAAVLAEAQGLASAGFGSDAAKGRDEAAAMITAVIDGWRLDAERGRRLETISEALHPLLSEEPWTTLRDPLRREKLPAAERKRWEEIASAVDRLERLVEERP